MRHEHRFELGEATSGNLTDPVYLAARAESLRLARDEGIDRVLRLLKKSREPGTGQGQSFFRLHLAQFVEYDFVQQRYSFRDSGLTGWGIWRKADNRLFFL